jgi:inner membrane protein
VSPIGIARFLSARGVDVLLSELLWIWLPCAAVAGMLVAQRRGGAHR